MPAPTRAVARAATRASSLFARRALLALALFLALAPGSAHAARPFAKMPFAKILFQIYQTKNSTVALHVYV